MNIFQIQDVKHLAMKVDTIFSSLGMNISDPEIWNKSYLSKPKSTNSSCVPKVMNMFDTHVRYTFLFKTLVLI